MAIADMVQIPSFQRVYDALDVFSNQKINMGKYDTSDLKTGDIVVVEMAVIRWPIKEENASGKKIWRNRKEWKKWNVDFRLESVAVLYPGSDYADEPVEETDLPDDLAA